MKILLFAISLIMSILPFPILAFLYELVPSQVPLFVDLAGNPTVMTTKSIFSVFRLPTMGLMVQAICIIMYLIDFNDISKLKTNKRIWLAISFIGAIKMSITSLEILIYENTLVLNIFRTSVLITVIVAVIILLYNLFVLYREDKNQFLKEYHKAISKGQYNAIAIALAAYILLVFLPIFI
jgi:uncharacterized membrane protein